MALQIIERSEGKSRKETTRTKAGQAIPSPLILARTEKEKKEISELRRETYKTWYPDIKNFDTDPYDKSAHIIFSRDEELKVNSTARLVMDGMFGLPEDAYFPPEVMEYRKQGLRLMELGRFIIKGGDKRLLKKYYQAFYALANAEKVGVILMAMKQKDIAFHQHLIGIKVLSADMNLTYGGKHKLACVSWEITNTKARFFKWTGLNNTNKIDEEMV
jgi:hypothetical protein